MYINQMKLFIRIIPKYSKFFKSEIDEIFDKK